MIYRDLAKLASSDDLEVRKDARGEILKRRQKAVKAGRTGTRYEAGLQTLLGHVDVEVRIDAQKELQKMGVPLSTDAPLSDDRAQLRKAVQSVINKATRQRWAPADTQLAVFAEVLKWSRRRGRI